MKSNFKRVMSLVLTVLMVFTVVPFSGFATGDECADGHLFYGEFIERDGKHARWCSVCGEAFGYMDENDEPHEGFQECYSNVGATCKKRAVCDYCNREFGELSDEHTGTGSVDFAEKFIANAATCQSGAYYWYKCSECGEPMYDRESVQVGAADPNAHKYITAVSNGDGTHKAKCEYCENELDNIACSGGTATCTKKAVCAYCSAEYGEAKGHDYSKKIIDEAHLKNAATCKEHATYWLSCSNKGCEVFASEETAADKFFTDTEGALKAHDFTAEVEEGYLATAGTCQKKATYYKSCSVCELSSQGTEYQATFEGSYGNHSYTKTDIKTDANLKEAATCTTKATYWKYCANEGCNACAKDDESAQDEFFTDTEGALKAHDFTESVANGTYLKSAATCKSYAVYYKSCKCTASAKGIDENATFSGDKYADHVWGEYVNDNNATCENNATKTAECQTPGCTETRSEEIEGTKLSHSYTKTDVTTDANLKDPATCTTKATYWKYCANEGCNACAKDDASAADAYFESGNLASHVYQREVEDDKYNRTDATCMAKATRWYVCNTCDKSAKDVEGIEKPYYEYGTKESHDYSQEVLDDKYIVEDHEATCTTDAIYWYVCSQEGCTAFAGEDENAKDKYYTAKDTATGHDPVEIPAVEPTCTKAGSTAGSQCKICKVYLVEPQERAALGHTEYVAVAAVAATCSKAGCTEEKRCLTCDELLSLPSMPTKSLGHVDSNGDGVCDREGCYTIMEDVVECSCICHQSGLIGVIAYIVILIWKLLGVNQYCDCGVQHY